MLDKSHGNKKDYFLFYLQLAHLSIAYYEFRICDQRNYETRLANLKVGFFTTKTKVAHVPLGSYLEKTLCGSGDHGERIRFYVANVARPVKENRNTT